MFSHTSSILCSCPRCKRAEAAQKLAQTLIWEIEGLFQYGDWDNIKKIADTLNVKFTIRRNRCKRIPRRHLRNLYTANSFYRIEFENNHWFRMAAIPVWMGTPDIWR